MFDVIEVQEKLMEREAGGGSTAATAFHEAQEILPKTRNEGAEKQEPVQEGAVKRGRGRPKKAPEAGPVIKRGRGRPGKEAAKVY
jgi:hypothetical protein